MSRTSSGSSCSESGVKPTRSQKRAVTRRRSSVGGTLGTVGARIASATEAGAGDGADRALDSLNVWRGEAAAWRAVPHSSQNFCLAVTGLPQAGQTRGSAAPHSAQNFLPAAPGVPQLGQGTVAFSIVPLSYHLPGQRARAAAYSHRTMEAMVTKGPLHRACFHQG